MGSSSGESMVQILNPTIVCGLLKLLPGGEHVAAWQLGDGLGTAPLGDFFDRQTVSQLRTSMAKGNPTVCLKQDIVIVHHRWLNYSHILQANVVRHLPHSSGIAGHLNCETSLNKPGLLSFQRQHLLGADLSVTRDIRETP